MLGKRNFFMRTSLRTHRKPHRNLHGLLLSGLAFNLSACAVSGSGSSTLTEDISTSGSLVSALGGAISGSTSSGKMSQFKNQQPNFLNYLFILFQPESEALASNTCE